MPVKSTSTLRTLFGLGCTAACLLSLPAAADYRAQIDVQYDSARLVGSGDPSQDIFAVAASYYFDAISEDNELPLSTLAFTQRASSVSIARAEAHGFGDAAATGISGRWVAPGSGIIAEVAYADGEDEAIDVWSLGVGMYVAENQAVVLSYSETDTGEADVDQDFLGLRYNGVLEAAEGYTELGLALSYSDDNEDNEFTWQGNAAWYPVRDLGFGFTVGEILSDLGGETDILGVNVEMFPVSSVAVSLAYEVLGLDNDPDFDDIKTFSVGITGRL